jgi:hypothetical protein
LRIPELNYQIESTNGEDNAYLAANVVKNCRTNLTRRHDNSEAHNLPDPEERLHESRYCFFSMHWSNSSEKIKISWPDLEEAACSGDGRAESATYTGITQINLEECIHG